MIYTPTYMSAPQTFSENFHLESSDPNTNPNYTNWMGDLITSMKGSHPEGGWPADTFVLDGMGPGSIIRQARTELDYTSARNYKTFDINHDGSNVGIPWMPQLMDPNNPATMLPLVCNTPWFKTYINCLLTNTQSLGLTVCQPFYCDAFPFGGDIGTVKCIGVFYTYNSAQNVCEIHHYALDYGPALWIENKKDSSNNWYQSQYKLKNLVKPGGSPIPYFPCGLPQ